MTDTALVGRLTEPLYKVKGWMKLAGVLAIIQGVLSIFSLWGILICWIPIWMGILLYKASNQLAIAKASASETELIGVMQKLATYFKIFGVLLMVALLVALLGIVAAIMIPNFMHYREAAMGG